MDERKQDSTLKAKAGQKVKCPECNTSIKAKHYDPEAEWYECPGCEGCFTADEIIREEVAKKPSIQAKGKRRRTEIEDDEQLAITQLEETAKNVVKLDARVKRHRDEAPTGEVVNIMADEIQTIYAEMGGQLDDGNARDKALILWRDLSLNTHVTAREQEVPHALCKEHA